MISVILIWLYMTVTCYIIGFACIRGISGILLQTEKFRLKSETAYIYAGIGAVTVYSQFYSIFSGVGLGANIGLLLICVLCVCIFFREYVQQFHAWRLTVTVQKILVAGILFLLFAYGTSFGIIHYDTSLYMPKVSGGLKNSG